MGNESGITLLAAVARGLENKAASAYCMYGVAVPHGAAPWKKLRRWNQAFWMDILLLHLEQTKTGLELRPSPATGEGAASSACYSPCTALYKTGNQTHRQVNTLGHAASAPPAAMSCGTWGATKRSEKEDTWPNPFPKSGLFAFQRKNCGVVLARWWEDGDGWALRGLGLVLCWVLISHLSQCWEVWCNVVVTQTLCERLEDDFYLDAEGIWTSSSLDWDFCHVLCHLFLISLRVPSGLLPALLRFLCSLSDRQIPWLPRLCVSPAQSACGFAV